MADHSQDSLIVILANPASWDRRHPIRAQARFAETHLAFAGHFPGDPILPGFLHVQLALDVLRLAGWSKGDLAAVATAKFLRPIHPHDLVDLALYPLTGDAIDVQLEVNGQAVSHFQITLDAPTTAENH